MINFWTLYPGVKFYNDYPDCYRKRITFLNTLYKRTIDRRRQVWIIDSASACTPVFYGKFMMSTIDYINANPALLEDSVLWDFGVLCPVYLLRYTHVLLTYAEAKARSGDLDASAFEALNMVRRRAHLVSPMQASEYDLQPGLSAEQFADSVVRERALEHAGEQEGRWFDLQRLEMVEQLESLQAPEEITDFEGPYDASFYFLSIPPGEM